MKSVRLSLLARSDLAEVRHFIARDKPRAADRQIAMFHSVFRALAKNRELGEVREDLGTGLRVLSLGTYVIVYRPIPSGVEIARVVSGFRDWESLF